MILIRYIGKNLTFIDISNLDIYYNMDRKITLISSYSFLLDYKCPEKHGPKKSKTKTPKSPAKLKLNDKHIQAYFNSRVRSDILEKLRLIKGAGTFRFIMLYNTYYNTICLDSPYENNSYNMHNV